MDFYNKNVLHLKESAIFAYYFRYIVPSSLKDLFIINNIILTATFTQ